MKFFGLGIRGGVAKKLYYRSSGLPEGGGSTFLSMLEGVQQINLRSRRGEIKKIYDDKTKVYIIISMTKNRHRALHNSIIMTIPQPTAPFRM